MSGLGSSWRHAPCGYWSPGGWSSSVRVAWGLLGPVQQPCSQGEVKVELGSSSDKMVRTSKRQYVFLDLQMASSYCVPRLRSELIGSVDHCLGVKYKTWPMI